MSDKARRLAEESLNRITFKQHQIGHVDEIEASRIIAQVIDDALRMLRLRGEGTSDSIKSYTKF